MYYAQIKNAICFSVTETSGEIVAADMIPIKTFDDSLLGKAWNGVAFVDPAPVVPKRWISVGAFFDRFGNAKGSILASTEPAVQALVTDCSVRAYIDLDNPEVAAGLQQLVGAGFDIDPSAILNAPIEPDERP